MTATQGTGTTRRSASWTSCGSTGTGALSTQVLQEFYVNATRKLARTIGRAEARDIVADYATWRVGALTVANPFGGPP